MQGKFRSEFLGLVSFTGKKETNKDKVYFSANLLQGSEVIKVFLQEGQEVLFAGLNKMDEVELELEIQIREKTYVSLKSVTPLENGKPITAPLNQPDKKSA